MLQSMGSQRVELNWLRLIAALFTIAKTWKQSNVPEQ